MQMMVWFQGGLLEILISLCEPMPFFVYSKSAEHTILIILISSPIRGPSISITLFY